MTTRRWDFDPANADDNGIADNLIAGAGPWTSATAEWVATTSGDGLAHKLVLTTAGDEPAGNGPTATIAGTDADGNAITDTVVLPNATTVESSEYFKTVTSIAVDADTVGTFDVGWVDEFVSETIILDEQFVSNWQLDLTGTISIDSDWMLKDVRQVPKLSEQNIEPWIDGAIAALDAETADSSAMVVAAAGYKCMRFRVNSYTDTAEFQIYMSQQDTPRPPR